ncbi:MAG: HD domain-containing protein [Clostridia bacterium]|nr:HD domain-containing protein [Clostridia bacterium]
MRVTPDMIDALRDRVSKLMSPFRFEHTLGVERMAIRLARLYCPERTEMLRAAALLHDVTKEYSFEEQMDVFERYGVKLTEEQKEAKPTLHAYTAALIIPDEYPDYASEELVDAVRYHSTGRAGMTVYDKILYLADYIEDTRKYEDCIALRLEFFSAEPEKMEIKERVLHLNRVLLHSITLTLDELREKGRPIEGGTLEAFESIGQEIDKE